MNSHDNFHFYQAHQHLKKLNPETDYREIVSLYFNRLLPQSRILIEYIAHQAVMYSAVKPEDLPPLYKGGKSAFIKTTNKRMCDQNIFFSAFYNHNNRDEYNEAIQSVNYMHTQYPEYINQRTLFRAGITFMCVVSIVENNIAGEHSAFKLFGNNSEKFEQSMYLLWSDIFKDMKIKGMPNSYQEALDFCFDKDNGPMYQDYFPEGSDDAEHFFDCMIDNLVEQNIPKALHFTAPLIRNLFIVGMHRTTRISTRQAKKLKGEAVYSTLMKLALKVVSFRINYLPIIKTPGYTFADLFNNEYESKGISAVENAGIASKPGNKDYQDFKDNGGETPWEGCPFHSSNKDVV